jgi:putative chitinase
MSPTQLAAAIGCTLDRATKWHPHIAEAMARFDITTPNEMASFIAQLAHESAHLSRLEENLNYSADGLAATWPARYRDKATSKPNQLALLLHRRPVAIANNCYANRMGNGDVATGDGWRYRGRGPIQITGKSNYERCGKAIGVPLLSNPDLLLEPRAGALSAGWFWHVNGLDKHDDDASVLAETKIINGGTNGLAERQKFFNIALKAFSEVA